MSPIGREDSKPTPMVSLKADIQLVRNPRQAELKPLRTHTLLADWQDIQTAFKGTHITRRNARPKSTNCTDVAIFSMRGKVMTLQRCLARKPNFYS